MVNELAPGIIDTDMHAHISAEVRKHNVDKRIPLHRYGVADDVAEAALFLLRQDYMTGEVLTIDGGLGMRLAQHRWQAVIAWYPHYSQPRASPCTTYASDREMRERKEC